MMDDLDLNLALHDLPGLDMAGLGECYDWHQESRMIAVANDNGSVDSNCDMFNELSGSSQMLKHAPYVGSSCPTTDTSLSASPLAQHLANSLPCDQTFAHHSFDGSNLNLVTPPSCLGPWATLPGLPGGSLPCGPTLLSVRTRGCQIQPQITQSEHLAPPPPLYQYSGSGPSPRAGSGVGGTYAAGGASMGRMNCSPAYSVQAAFAGGQHAQGISAVKGRAGQAGDDGSHASLGGQAGSAGLVPQSSHQHHDVRRDRLNTLIEVLAGEVPSTDCTLSLGARRSKHVVLADTLATMRALRSQVAALEQRLAKASLKSLKSARAPTSANDSTEVTVHASRRPSLFELPLPMDIPSSATGVMVQAEPGSHLWVLRVTCSNRVGLLADVATALGTLPLTVLAASLTTSSLGKAQQVYQLSVSEPTLSTEELQCTVNAALYAHLVTPPHAPPHAPHAPTLLAMQGSSDTGSAKRSRDQL